MESHGYPQCIHLSEARTGSGCSGRPRPPCLAAATGTARHPFARLMLRQPAAVPSEPARRAAVCLRTCRTHPHLTQLSSGGLGIDPCGMRITAQLLPLALHPPTPPPTHARSPRAGRLLRPRLQPPRPQACVARVLAEGHVDARHFVAFGERRLKGKRSAMRTYLACVGDWRGVVSASLRSSSTSSRDATADEAGSEPPSPASSLTGTWGYLQARLLPAASLHCSIPPSLRFWTVRALACGSWSFNAHASMVTRRSQRGSSDALRVRCARSLSVLPFCQDCDALLQCSTAIL